MRDVATGPSRRKLLTLIGRTAGAAAAYDAMTNLGFAAPSPYKGPITLDGDPKGASVLILGAGLAGMTAAIELGRAGYRVQLLEYNTRAGGRNWSLRGGDRYTELGGITQTCAFDAGLYFNPGPWRIPYHHGAVLDYCRRFGVALEPFIQLNHNAYLHGEAAFGGRPQRIRAIKSDFDGGVAELLAKATRKGALDEAVSREDGEILLEALRSTGALDKDFAYKAGAVSAEFRGYAKDPGGGLSARPMVSEPIGLSDILTSRLWRGLQNFLRYEMQTTMFQPVGGMGRIGEAFARQLPNVIRYGAKVTAISQDARGVRVTFADQAQGGAVSQATADWCVCALPLSILSQVPLDVSRPMKAAIDAVPYSSSVKFGLQFRRRFWEEDEGIFGGISYTDLPIRQIVVLSLLVEALWELEPLGVSLREQIPRSHHRERGPSCQLWYTRRRTLWDHRRYSCIRSTSHMGGKLCSLSVLLMVNDGDEKVAATHLPGTPTNCPSFKPNSLSTSGPRASMTPANSWEPTLGRSCHIDPEAKTASVWQYDAA